MSPEQPDGPEGAAPPSQPTARFTLDALDAATTRQALHGKEGPVAVLHAFFQLFRTARIHDIDNQALQRPLHNFVEVTAGVIAREGELSFQAREGALFLNQVQIRMSSEEYELAEAVFAFLAERELGGFSMAAPLDVAGVRTLLQALVYAPPEQRRHDPIEAALKAAGLPLQVNRSLGVAAPQRSAALERRAYTFFTYSKLVVLYRALLAEERVNPMKWRFLTKKIGRTIQALVDVCLEDDHTFLGLAAVKSGEAYAPHHAANVAVLSIAAGAAIGLRKVELADLGLAGVFHDIGVKYLPASILDKPGPLSEAERAILDQHPLRGVGFLLGDRTMTRSLLSEIVVAFEHARKGKPLETGQQPSLFARIVALACSYDALTTNRPWRKAFLPDEAFAKLMQDAGRRFDTGLLKVFVNTIGLYPAGTLVRLSSGELAVVVMSGGEAERATRPLVALLGPDGRPGRGVDLTEKDASGHYLRAIVSSEDPVKYGLQPAGLLAQGAGA